MTGCRPEDVDDAAPDGNLAPRLDLVFAAIAGTNKAAEELLGVELGAFLDDDGLDVFHARAKPLHKGTNGGDHDARSALGRRRSRGAGF